MKRFLAILFAIVILSAIPIASGAAAGNSRLGELYITSDKVSGEVGDLVKVNFYVYPNLPEGRKLDTFIGYIKYDPEILKYGAYNLVDKEENLTSFMQMGERPVYSFVPNYDEPGYFRFVYISVYGAEAEGFWLQLVFRIEKEGATDFVFNGISYTGFDSEMKTESYYIEPVSVGGVYTEGQTVPSEGTGEETYAPLTPGIETPVTASTPKASDGGKTTPAATASPAETPTETPSQEASVEPTAPAKETATASDPPAASPGEAQASGETGNNAIAEPTADLPEEPAALTAVTGHSSRSNMLLVAGVIVGIIAVIGLGALAILLILKGCRLDDE